MAVDIIGMPFYSSRHPGGSHFQGDQEELGERRVEKRCKLHLKQTNDSWLVDETYIKVKGK